MDGPFYNDLREPHSVGPTDIAAVTLAATNKALYTVAAFPPLPSNYFSRPGKKLHIVAFGRMTTGATPGNLTVGILYGTGADANGVILNSSAAVALSINQTSLPWKLHAWVKCVTPGATGTLFAWGSFEAHVSVLASTLQPMFIPAATPAVSGACDLTVANIISLQALRSGSTAETMQCHDVSVVSMN